MKTRNRRSTRQSFVECDGIRHHHCHLVWISIHYLRRLPADVWTTWIIVAVSWIKNAFFGIENLQQLLSASRQNLAYHRFMVLMFVNMTQIILHWVGFHCLHTLQSGCFSSIPAQFSQGELVFEFIYFSSLNFTFFGYGDVTPTDNSSQAIDIDGDLPCLCHGHLLAVRLHQPEGIATRKVAACKADFHSQYKRPFARD